MEINEKQTQIIKTALEQRKKSLSYNLGKAFARKDVDHILEIRTELMSVQSILNKF